MIITIELMAIEVFGPGVAFTTVLLRTKEGFLQAFSTALSFPMLLRCYDFSTVFLLVATVISSPCDMLCLTIVPETMQTLKP